MRAKQLDMLTQTVALLEQRLTLSEDKSGQMEGVLGQILQNQKAMMTHLQQQR